MDVVLHIWAWGGGDDYDYLYLRGHGASSDDRKFTPFDYSSSLTGKHQSVFNLIFGSYLADWDYQNSHLRSSIAEPER